jgi:hypothetical protein
MPPATTSPTTRHQPLHHTVLFMLWNTAKKAVAEDEIVGEKKQ